MLAIRITMIARADPEIRGVAGASCGTVPLGESNGSQETPTIRRSEPYEAPIVEFSSC